MARNTVAPIQMYRGTTAQHGAYTGPVGELTVDTDKLTVVVQDGTTAGGHPLAKEAVKVISGSDYVTINNGTETTLAGDVTIDVAADELVKGIVATDDPLLYVDDSSKVAAKLSVTYDVLTGAFQVIGQDGSTVVASATIPGATTAVKAVNLVDAKPDASGEAVAGQYHISLQFKDTDGNYGVVSGVTFTATSGTASSAVTVAGTISGSAVAGVRGWFNGQEAEADVASGAATLSFDDGSVVQLSAVAASGTDVTGSATMTPAVGLVKGEYLLITWTLYDGTVHDTYVDVSDLVDVYTAGTGLTLASNEFSVDESWLATQIENKVEEEVAGGLVTGSDSIEVSTSGSTATVSVNETWLASQIESKIDETVNAGELVAAGDGISVSNTGGVATVAAKAGDDSVTVDADGIKVAATWLDQQIADKITETVNEGELVKGSESVTVDSADGSATVSVNETWLTEKITEQVAADVTVVSKAEGNLITGDNSTGAFLNKDAITDTVTEIIEDTLTAEEGSIACAMVSETEGNQLSCDSGKLLVVSDYGTMD